MDHVEQAFRSDQVIVVASVVVRDFDFRRALLGPAKAHPPLIVDANAVLALPVSAQGLEVVRRQAPKIRQRICRNHVLDPHAGATPDVGGNSANTLSEENAFTILVLEPLQPRTVTEEDNNVKGYYPARHGPSHTCITRVTHSHHATTAGAIDMVDSTASAALPLRDPA